ncbi:hypothetical protein KCP71_17165 [Salmonella enterica subsp. enterica]|nr:hypothetical protein KCP71_17165 [Salmonella enterica subsp. enterica]
MTLSASLIAAPRATILRCCEPDSNAKQLISGLHRFWTVCQRWRLSLLAYYRHIMPADRRETPLSCPGITP